LIADKLSAESMRLETSGPEFASAYQRLIDRLVGAGAGATAPRRGDSFPEFLLPDDEGRLMSRQDLAAGKTLVVSLNRGHWCSYCRIELEGLQEVQEEILRRDGRVVAITPDRRAYARRLREHCNLTFPLLSDVGNGFATSLGLVVWCGDEIRTLYKSSDINLNEYQGDEGWLMPIPATYVVAPDGEIRASFVNPDFRRRMEPADILVAL
jgi:peroxiredoxin